MNCVQEFQKVMEEYDAAVQELQKGRRMFDGILGLGASPGSAACHEILDRQIAEICRNAMSEEVSAAERAGLIQAIFQAEGRWQGPEYARLMLVAIQRHTLGLIPMLEGEDREKQAEWYRKTYPRRKRLPAQEQVLKALMA